MYILDIIMLIPEILIFKVYYSDDINLWLSLSQTRQ